MRGNHTENVTHVQTVCNITGPLFFWKGPGYEANININSAHVLHTYAHTHTHTHTHTHRCLEREWKHSQANSGINFHRLLSSLTDQVGVHQASLLSDTETKLFAIYH